MGVSTLENVGPAGYYFYFSKANDGVRITSNDVKMFND
jgi:NurA-like 5'-3' nuclease